MLDGRFALLELIDHGGMASVFKATDLQSGDVVALKIPFTHLARDSVFRERFQREIDIGRLLDHPAIVKVLPVPQGGRLYLAMEFADGETLWGRLQRESPVPTEDVLKIASRLCDAVGHMERHQVFHRDLKPSNVMLCRDGSVRIMDFGVAMTATAPRLTLAGAKGFGTMEYMAPEQVKGQRGDQRADIYGIGAILYEMTTGHRPYDEQPDMFRMTRARLVGDPVAPRVHNPALPPAVEEIILRCLARNPNDRYRCAADLQADLEDPAHVTMTGRASRLRSASVPSQARQVVLLIVASLLVPVILFFLLLLLLNRHH